MATEGLNNAGATAEFRDLLDTLDLVRTLDGLMWTVPLRVRVPVPRVEAGRPSPPPDFACLTELRADLRVKPVAGGELWTCAALPIGESYARRETPYFEVHLRFPLSGSALSRLELLRDGGQPAFSIILGGSVHLIGAYVRDHDCNVGSYLGGCLGFKVTREAWTDRLRELKIAHSLVFEVPLVGSPRSAFKKVHTALGEAKLEFDKGGELGWRNCIGAIRHAMDAWPGGAKPANLKGALNPQWALPERIQAIREALRHATHPAHHALSSGWTRAQALMLLAMATSLASHDGA